MFQNRGARTGFYTEKTKEFLSSILSSKGIVPHSIHKTEKKKPRKDLEKK